MLRGVRRDDGVMSVDIRRATPRDWRALRCIRLASLADAPTAFASTLERELGFSEETWRSRVEAHPVFLAVRGEDVVGTATAYDDHETERDTVSLIAMYVAPTARGTGCAHLLIDAVVHAARAGGATSLLLYVTDVNPVAERCYRRYGFTATGRRRPLRHNAQISEIEMILELA